MSKFSKLCGIRWYKVVFRGLLILQTSPMNMLSSTAPLGSSARASHLCPDPWKVTNTVSWTQRSLNNFKMKQVSVQSPGWSLSISGLLKIIAGHNVYIQAFSVQNSNSDGGLSSLPGINLWPHPFPIRLTPGVGLVSLGHTDLTRLHSLSSLLSPQSFWPLQVSVVLMQRPAKNIIVTSQRQRWQTGTLTFFKFYKENHL